MWHWPRNWDGKAEERDAVYANRRRINGERGKRLQSQRGEKIERNFAHQFDTGGMDRLYLRGRENIHKRLLIQAAACNLALLLRSLHGAGKPRAAHDLKSATNLAFLRLTIAIFGMGCVDLANPLIPCTNSCDRGFYGERTRCPSKRADLGTGC
jgi:hypothetical protein